MTPRPPRAALAAVATCAALVAGCQPTAGSSTKLSRFTGAQRQAAQAVVDLQSAADDGKYDHICRDLLAKALADRLAARGHGCADVVHEAIRDSDSIDMTVQSVRVTGPRASARVKLETGKKDRTATLALVREGGTWRIAGL
jgi:Putative lumazine-binding